MPLTRRTWIYGEAGIGITSRHGFSVGETPVVRDAHYASLVVGGGLEYQISETFDLTAGAIYSPSRGDEPAATLASAGFRYTMRPLSEERVEANRRAGFAFPENLVQIEYSTGYGYGINDFVSRTVPVFWRGNVQVDRGLAVHYDRNVFHTRKIFALDLGTSVSWWRSRSQHDRFVTLSAYPLLRFTPIRRKQADVYFCYSLAGPTYISRHVIDARETGNHFTFQDFMGAGVLLGRTRSITVGVKINHYSNGNIFTQNAGLKIPVTITAGYAF